MLNKKTILFLTGKYDSSVAEAIYELLVRSPENLPIIINQRELENGFKIHVLDKLLPLSSGVRRFARNIHLMLKDAAPDKKSVQTISFKPAKIFDKHIYNAINRYTPDLVAVTSDVVLEPTLNAIYKTGRNTKVMVIGEGFLLSRRMINRNVDFYFVDNFDMRNRLIEGGIGSDRIEIAPLPLKLSAMENISKEDAGKKMALDPDKKTVFIHCGGLDKFAKAINALALAGLNANIIVACGKNVKLLNLARNKGLIAYNESLNVHVAVSAADLVISNADAPIIAEAAAKKKLVFGIYPVSRKDNLQLEYLSTDAIVKIADEKELVAKTAEFISDRETGSETAYEDIYKALAEREAFHSAKVISDKIIEIIDRENSLKEKIVSPPVVG